MKSPLLRFALLLSTTISLHAADPRYSPAWASIPPKRVIKHAELNPHHPTLTGDSWAGGLEKENPFSSVSKPSSPTAGKPSG